MSDGKHRVVEDYHSFILNTLPSNAFIFTSDEIDYYGKGLSHEKYRFTSLDNQGYN